MAELTCSSLLADSSRSIGRHVLAGIVTLLLLGGTAVAWSVFAPLSGAVIAGGVVVVEGNLKRVQHPTGGIVGALLVQEGDRVKAGDLLVRLDETATRANLGIIINELTALRARLGRLTAERNGEDEPAFPADIVARAAAEAELRRTLDGERNLLQSQLRTRRGQREQLGERIVQLREEITGLEAQRVALEAQARVAQDESKDLEDLYRRNLVQRSRVSQLEREIIRINGSIGDMTARIAQSRGRISEVELQILQIDKERATEVAKEIRETETRIGELNERKLAAEDQLRRIEVRAPGTGIVHQLAAHTVGGVVGPGETIMQIVPENEALVVEVRINPVDIDQVRIGQDARIKLSAFNPRTTPDLNGSISRIAADLTRDDKTGLTFYTAGVRIPDAELARLGSLKLLPGMPAEVYMRTRDRSLAEFLVQPLLDHMGRAMREE